MYISSVQDLMKPYVPGPHPAEELTSGPASFTDDAVSCNISIFLSAPNLHTERPSRSSSPEHRDASKPVTVYMTYQVRDSSSPLGTNGFNQRLASLAGFSHQILVTTFWISSEERPLCDQDVVSAEELTWQRVDLPNRSDLVSKGSNSGLEDMEKSKNYIADANKSSHVYMERSI
ncbi:hypothetical protein SCARD494_00302 [Seiridium cardinale]